MGAYAAGGIKETGYGGVGWAYEARSGDAIECGFLALVEEIEKEAIEGTGGWTIADWGAVSGHF